MKVYRSSVDNRIIRIDFNRVEAFLLIMFILMVDVYSLAAYNLFAFFVLGLQSILCWYVFRKKRISLFIIREDEYNLRA